MPLNACRFPIRQTFVLIILLLLVLARDSLGSGRVGGNT